MLYCGQYQVYFDKGAEDICDGACDIFKIKRLERE